MEDIKDIVKSNESQIVHMRRELHQIPETAYNEVKTSAYVAKHLEAEGLEVKTGIAKHGVVGLMRTGRSGPTLMIRADMDALPIKEETGLSCSSTHEGVMHACGHDGHMAMALGAAQMLVKVKEELVGNVKFVFQPAEEGPGGAKPMIEAGIMEDPRVDYAVGCHVWPGLPSGAIGVKAGPIMAAMDRFDIKILGRGGHGAMPHMCIDALEVGTQVVNALQRIVSRHMNPLSPTVVTVGTFQAGTAFNIIPREAVLSGTTRTFNHEIWHSWEERIENIVRGVCSSMGARYELDFQQGYPPTVNDAFMTDVVVRCAQAVLGKDQVVEPESTMGGEDMSYYLEKTQGCFFFLGVGLEGGAPVHNPGFTLDEDALVYGTETFCRVALELCKRHKA